MLKTEFSVQSQVRLTGVLTVNMKVKHIYQPPGNDGNNTDHYCQFLTAHT